MLLLPRNFGTMHVGNVHVVAMPRWTSFVGVARLIIALFILIFVATTAGLWYSANYVAMGIALFTVSAPGRHVYSQLTASRPPPPSSSLRTTLSASAVSPSSTMLGLYLDWRSLASSSGWFRLHYVPTGLLLLTTAGTGVRSPTRRRQAQALSSGIFLSFGTISISHVVISSQDHQASGRLAWRSWALLLA